MKSTLKKFSYAVLSILAIVAFVYLAITTDAATKTGFSWNTTEYSGGKPMMSVNFEGLDSANGNMSDYDDGTFSTFQAANITMAITYKAPANDTSLVIIVTQSTNPNTKSFTGKPMPTMANNFLSYNIDTQKVIGAASYVYTPVYFTLSLSGWGKLYAVYVIGKHAAGGTANRKNDSMYVSFSPDKVDYVPYGFHEFYGK